MGMSFTLVRPKRKRRKASAKRRRNTVVLPRGVRAPGGHHTWRTRRGKLVGGGGFIGQGAVQLTGRSKAGRSKRRRALKAMTLVRGKRRKNPGTTRRRRRTSRSTAVAPRRRRRARALAPVRRRRRRSSRRSTALAPDHRRRRRSSRRSTSLAPRRRRGRRHHAVRRARNGRGRIRTFRRRRNSGFAVRRRNPGIVGTFRSILTRETGVAVLGGTLGLSASLWGPKLAGHLLYAPLGRGWGGVVTSLVTVGLFSGVLGIWFPNAARAALASGLIGTFAGAMSAAHCGIRNTILPFESGLLACALPTMPQSAPVGPTSAAGQAMYNSQVAAGVPAAIAMQNVKQAGLADYVPAPTGMHGYGGNYPAGVASMLANEQAFRSAAGGLNDYSAQIAQRSRGMGDYAQFPQSDVSSGMDASPESF